MEQKAANERVRLSLSTHFGAVQVSDGELNEAMTTLVVNMPLRVASSRFPLYLNRKRGGPWTPLFKKIFDKAGLSMEDSANTVSLVGHKGPHPEEYHQIVYNSLESATENCSTRQECALALKQTLQKLAVQIIKEGSRLNKLLTEGAAP